MAINQVTLTQVQNEILAMGAQLNSFFNRVQLYAVFIQGLGVAGLEAAPYSMSSADATLVFNAAQDLDNFRKVYAGLEFVASGATLNSGTPTPNDGTHFGYPFSLNVGKCAGLGY